MITRPQWVNQHIPQHQYELKFKNKMVAKVTTASKVTPCNGNLYGLISVRNLLLIHVLCVFFLCRDYTALYTLSRCGWKVFHSHLYALRYVPLFGHHQKFCSKFMLISNNYIFSQLFYYVLLFCIKTGEWHLKGMCFCSLIIMMPHNGLVNYKGAGAPSRHTIEVFLDYSDFNRGAKLI